MLLCFRFSPFGFEAIPHRSCYLTSIADTMGQFLLCFCATSVAFLATPDVS